ncbi:TetR/AcrR family transcriptional regulator [Neobacillus niacini]|uniref:TetR/AcrR family transcriptional regulator n=1 Tax=Neobacillus niacini TaxID=86668 RepID=UPI00285F69B9|nr:TetR/AcrR family transcriptional regulator [Neobacillus niacini]MDR7002539.1 AcrR family transcriptional regulator [Neobacillus niacini]
MFSKFLNLDQEKQDRIINAAIKEFAQKGYDNASTNEIVKEAGISKGLLFHYFGNKKKMYLFVFDHFYEIIVDEFYKKINLQERDIFKRVRQAVSVKMELLNKYPDLFNFLSAAVMEDSKEVKLELDQRIKQLAKNNIGKLYEDIDLSLFRDDIDVQKALKIIFWTFEQFSDELIQRAKLTPTHEINYDEAIKETEEYYEVLMKAFYK